MQNYSWYSGRFAYSMAYSGYTGVSRKKLFKTLTSKRTLFNRTFCGLLSCWPYGYLQVVADQKDPFYAFQNGTIHVSVDESFQTCYRRANKSV